MKRRSFVAIVALIAVGFGAFFVLRSRPADADILYQDPTSRGPSPFTQATDVVDRNVTYGGPFGGSGDNTVCKPKLLIKYLSEHPDRLAAWAGVLDIDPDDMEEYIKSLRPVILTRDVRVTNHGFKNGKAFSLQSILAKGTAVLVDDKGNPVVRCRCGNPLLPPLPLTNARCSGCPSTIIPTDPCDDDCFTPACKNGVCPSPEPTPTPRQTGVPNFPKEPTPTPTQYTGVPVGVLPTPTPEPQYEEREPTCKDDPSMPGCEQYQPDDPYTPDPYTPEPTEPPFEPK